MGDDGWHFNEQGHWKNCILCGMEEHRTQMGTHSFGEDDVCDCGYQKPAHSKGDLDGDGSVTISDVTKLLTVLSGSGSLPEGVSGDLDADGNVNISDVTWLLTFLSGK